MYHHNKLINLLNNSNYKINNILKIFNNLFTKPIYDLILKSIKPKNNSNNLSINYPKNLTLNEIKKLKINS